MLFTIGDIVQQKLDINKSVLGKNSKNTEREHYNYFQTLKLVTYGVVASPINHIFYTKLLPKMAPLSSNPTLREMGWKLLVDYALLSSR